MEMVHVQAEARAGARDDEAAHVAQVPHAGGAHLRASSNAQQNPRATTKVSRGGATKRPRIKQSLGSQEDEEQRRQTARTTTTTARRERELRAMGPLCNQVPF